MQHVCKWMACRLKNMNSCLSQSAPLALCQPPWGGKKLCHPGASQQLHLQLPTRSVLQNIRLPRTQAGRLLCLLHTSLPLHLLPTACQQETHPGAFIASPSTCHNRHRSPLLHPGQATGSSLMHVPIAILILPSCITAGGSSSSSSIQVTRPSAPPGMTRGKAWGMQPLPCGIGPSSTM